MNFVFKTFSETYSIKVWTVFFNTININSKIETINFKHKLLKLHIRGTIRISVLLWETFVLFFVVKIAAVKTQKNFPISEAWTQPRRGRGILQSFNFPFFSLRWKCSKLYSQYYANNEPIEQKDLRTLLYFAVRVNLMYLASSERINFVLLCAIYSTQS